MNQAQYCELLGAINKAWLHSRVYREHPEWFYGVASTRITPGRPLIVGLNWGVSPKGRHEEPTIDHFPTKPLEDQIESWDEMGSLTRLKPFLESYIPDWREGGQANLYFFRTKNESQLCHDDRLLCEPLFTRFLSIAKPSMIVAVSAAVRDWFACQKDFLHEVERESIAYRQGAFVVLRARYVVDGKPGRFGSVPHPGAHFSAKSRRQAWDFAFPKAVA